MRIAVAILQSVCSCIRYLPTLLTYFYVGSYIKKIKGCVIRPTHSTNMAILFFKGFYFFSWAVWLVYEIIALNPFLRWHVSHMPSFPIGEPIKRYFSKWNIPFSVALIKKFKGCLMFSPVIVIFLIFPCRSSLDFNANAW